MNNSNEIIFLVEEDHEGGFTAQSLGYSIFTQGETLEALKDSIRDALSCHFDSEEEIPQIIRLHFVKDEVYAYA